MMHVCQCVMHRGVEPKYCCCSKFEAKGMSTKESGFNLCVRKTRENNNNLLILANGNKVLVIVAN